MGMSPWKQGRSLQTHHLCKNLFSWVGGMVFCLKRFAFSWQALDSKVFWSWKIEAQWLESWYCEWHGWSLSSLPLVWCCPGHYLSSSQWSRSESRCQHHWRPGCRTALALLEEAAQTKWTAKSRLCVQRVKVFPGEREAHIAAKCREKFISLARALFALF